jgi:hypothetical protein
MNTLQIIASFLTLVAFIVVPAFKQSAKKA